MDDTAGQLSANCSIGRCLNDRQRSPRLPSILEHRKSNKNIGGGETEPGETGSRYIGMFKTEHNSMVRANTIHVTEKSDNCH